MSRHRARPPVELDDVPAVTWPDVVVLFALVLLAVVGPFELAAVTRGYIFPPPVTVYVERPGRAVGITVPDPDAPVRALP